MTKIKFHVLRIAHTLLCAVAVSSIFLYLALGDALNANEFVNSMNKYLRIFLGVLGLIVTLLMSVIGLFYFSFVVQLYHFPEPGRRIKHKDFAQTTVTDSEEKRDEERDEKVKLPRVPLSQVGVRCLTEKGELLNVDRHVWDAAFYFSLINDEPNPVVISDIHAHVYFGESTLPPTASVLSREEVVLYEDNSIMSGGKSYRLEPTEVLPVRMSLRITCEHQESTWMSIFGLFFDYFRIESDSLHIRFPSDSIFVFQNHPGGHLVNVSKKNLPSYRERLGNSLAGFAMYNKFEKILSKHISSAFSIDGQV